MMKPSIYRSDDLITMELEVPQESYDAFIQKFESEQEALNMIEFMLEASLRRQRKIMYKKDTEERKKITVSILPALIPILETYCSRKAISKSEYLRNIMKWKRKGY